LIADFHSSIVLITKQLEFLLAQLTEMNCYQAQHGKWQ
jgi:hypothetical protein